MFVIDVKNCCLVCTPKDCRYVALSYVWGTGRMFKHIMANSDHLLTKGSLKTSEIPNTIRDAINLVDRIGQRYLWVDALCIIQDDVSMQQSQIAKMDRVYAEALFTIVAAYGNSAEAGLPGVSPGTRKQNQELLRLRDRSFLTILYDPTAISSSVWIRRAWTMQELLFSQRCLIFTANQVFWRCASATWLEELALEGAGSTALEILPANSEDQLPTGALDTAGYPALYRRLLLAYRQRRLSFQSDQLNAFAGVTSTLAAVQRDAFVWGLPRAQFAWALGWYFYGYHARHGAATKVTSPGGKVVDVPFPSWSWAAWGGSEYLPPVDFKGGPAGVTAEPRFGHARLQRATQFYVSDAAGRVVAVDEGVGRDGEESSVQQRRFPWQGEEWRSPAEQRVGTIAGSGRIGALYFWTSVATLKVGRVEKQEPERSDYQAFDPHGSEGIPVIARYMMMGSTSHIQGQPGYLKTERWPAGQPSTLDDMFDLDFVVIYKWGTMLILLAVEWIDGVAYRLGAAEVEEETWIGLKHRQWKLITLG
ncbi:putative heterokaryon incompatibility protein [Neofusicoccum parvum UCRNP2]|uniref:Putative heterokaryon incompatibility protein n=1 Tax=Botryosphaeria parva (strain UCR-NP2) TaxID=1287680 RepID=R1GRD7_BOTPV|nr:putative heterokaryon incompatibility protein [Neofusicoccum parvum UCRNP2]